MAFKYNGVAPTEIIYKHHAYSDRNLTILKYGDTAVWGKPFPLTISADSNVLLTLVKRDTSPNQHAATDGQEAYLTSGSLIYYGDTIIISVRPKSGYKLTTFSINGINIATGQTDTVTDKETVTSAINVIVKTTELPSWHTAWSGSYTLKTQAMLFGFAQGTPIALNRTYVNQGNMRITGYSSVDTTTRTQQMTKNQSYTTWGSAIVVQVVETTDSNATFKVSKQDTSYGSRSFTITKIEYYY
jgi:hypothetical protein